MNGIKQLSAIVATDLNNAIGFQNQLFDKGEGRKVDFDFFKSKTVGQTVIMGRKTFESIGKPLPNRTNIIISSTANDISAVEIVRDPCKYNWSMHENLVVIGGEQIYKLFWPYIDTFHVTKFFFKTQNADAFLPNLWEDFELSEMKDIYFPTLSIQIQKWLRLEK